MPNAIAAIAMPDSGSSSSPMRPAYASSNTLAYESKPSGTSSASYMMPLDPPTIGTR